MEAGRLELRLEEKEDDHGGAGMSEFNRRPDITHEEPESGERLNSSPEQRPANMDTMRDQASGYTGEARDRAGDFGDRAQERTSQFGSDGPSSGGMGSDQSGSKTDEARAKASEYGDKARETASQYGDKAKEQAEMGKDQAASGMEKAAGMMRERMGGSDGGVTGQAGTKVADTMETAASYLREHDTTEMWNDVESFAKTHPTQALAGAVVAGFLLGRLIR